MVDTCSVDRCSGRVVARGWCESHYRRWLRRNPRGPKLSLEERFWSKVEKSAGCWRWLASVDSKGYGQFMLNGSPKRAHRVSYELVHGAIPLGLQLDHLCRNIECVNPTHLEPVTHRINQLRGIGPVAINAAKTHCVRGHELTGDNLYIRKDTGARVCRSCQHIRYIKIKNA